MKRFIFDLMCRVHFLLTTFFEVGFVIIIGAFIGLVIAAALSISCQ